MLYWNYGIVLPASSLRAQLGTFSWRILFRSADIGPLDVKTNRLKKDIRWLKQSNLLRFRLLHA
jgi:hypothetical protein